VTSNFGANPCFLRSLRISRNAARLSRRRCTSISRTSPSWSTATREIHPLAGDANHHFVQVPSVAWARTARRSRRAITGPNLSTQLRTVFVRDVEPTLGKEILDVSVAEREAQVEPHGMLDDNRRKPDDDGMRVPSSRQPTRDPRYRPSGYPDKRLHACSGCFRLERLPGTFPRNARGPRLIADNPSP